MFSQTALSGMLLTALVAFFIPLVAAAWMRIRYRSRIFALITGVLSFILFGYYITGMLNVVLLNLTGNSLGWDSGAYRLVYILCYCLIAGVIEEASRLFCMRFVVKEPTLADGFMFGVGHGGAEAVMLTGLTSVQTWVLANAVNSSGLLATAELLSSDAADPHVQAGLYVEQINALLAENGINYFAEGLERILTLAMHVLLSALAVLALRKGSAIKYYLCAVCLHILCKVPGALHRTELIPNVWISLALTAALVVPAAMLVRSLYTKSGLPGLPEHGGQERRRLG